MRISDWSSDVCSSDLLFETTVHRRFVQIAVDSHLHDLFLSHIDKLARRLVRDQAAMIDDGDAIAKLLRSEEHTSELQSLMRISYAVFCLKKKKTLTTQMYQQQLKHHTTPYTDL